MKDTCVFSVIFPANLPFFEQYLQSLVNQEFNGFDVILLNDGVDESVLSSILKKYALDISFYPCHGTIASIRAYGLDLLRESKYKFIVFGDTDDFFSPNRISVSRGYLAKNCLVVNDVSLFFLENCNVRITSPKYFSNRMLDNQIVDQNTIIKYNFVGLGNTAIRKDILQPILIPEEVIAVDWFIFSYLFTSGIKGVFTNKSLTFYRQHEANITGFKQVNKESILKALQVKKNHYNNLKQQHEVFNTEYNKIVEIEGFISENGLDNYFTQVIKNLPAHPFWWEEIKTLEELS